MSMNINNMYGDRRVIYDLVDSTGIELSSEQ